MNDLPRAWVRSGSLRRQPDQRTAPEMTERTETEKLATKCLTWWNHCDTFSEKESKIKNKCASFARASLSGHVITFPPHNASLCLTSRRYVSAYLLPVIIRRATMAWFPHRSCGTVGTYITESHDPYLAIGGRDSLTHSLTRTLMQSITHARILTWYFEAYLYYHTWKSVDIIDYFCNAAMLCR